MVVVKVIIRIWRSGNVSRRRCKVVMIEVIMSAASHVGRTWITATVHRGRNKWAAGSHTRSAIRSRLCPMVDGPNWVLSHFLSLLLLRVFIK